MDKKDLVIPLNDLVIGSHCFRSKLEKEFFSGFDEDAVMDASVEVTVNVDKRSSDLVSIVCEVKGEVAVPCDRCLDDMEQPVSSTDKLLVKFGHEYAEEGENLIVIPEDEGIINVAWFMYEFVALAIPMKHVHAPGKCNKAMSSKLRKHLRTTPDEEEEDAFIPEDDVLTEEETETPIDPRWNELKKILDNN